jgi:Terminase small subunit
VKGVEVRHRGRKPARRRTATAPPSPSGLTQRERAFVIAYVEQGTGNASAAARVAGYANTKNLPRTAWELMQKPKIIAAIQAELSAGFDTAAPAALKTIRAMAQRPTRDGLRASLAILDRAGFMPVSYRKVSVEAKTPADTIRELAGVAQTLGKHPREIFGSVTDDERRLIETVLGPVFDVAEAVG